MDSFDRSLDLKDTRELHRITFTVSGSELIPRPNVKVYSSSIPHLISRLTDTNYFQIQAGSSVLLNPSCDVIESKAIDLSSVTVTADCYNHSASLINLEFDNPSAQVLNLCHTAVLGPEKGTQTPPSSSTTTHPLSSFTNVFFNKYININQH